MNYVLGREGGFLPFLSYDIEDKWRFDFLWKQVQENQKLFLHNVPRTVIQKVLTHRVCFHCRTL